MRRVRGRTDDLSDHWGTGDSAGCEMFIHILDRRLTANTCSFDSRD